MDLIYHETQTSSLCAIHALNSLFQGPFFNEVDLANLALELDRREREAMMEAGADTPEFLKFMAEDSGNVADDGNYSISVISEALRIWNVEIIPLLSPEAAQARKDIVNQENFICHMSNHWFCVKRIRSVWYNLNSLLDAPEALSDMYLELYLETMKQQGYTIFWVCGKINPPFDGGFQDGANWKRPKMHAGARPSATSNDDDELAMAVAASLQDATATQAAPMATDEESELEQALRMSRAPRVAVTMNTPGAICVILRLPNGTRLQKYFLPSDPVQNIVDVIEESGTRMTTYQLTSPLERKAYTDLGATLLEANITSNCSLTVTPK